MSKDKKGWIAHLNRVVLQTSIIIKDSLMKKFLFVLLAIVPLAMFAQGFKPTYEEKVVYEGSDVIFRQIDAHTWEGNGHLMANETLYLIEGEERAILLDGFME